MNINIMIKFMKVILIFFISLVSIYFIFLLKMFFLLQNIYSAEIIISELTRLFCFSFVTLFIILTFIINNFISKKNYEK